MTDPEQPPRRAVLALVLASLTVGLGGCAFLQEQNRPLLNALDRRIQPANPWAMVALSPVMIPTGLVVGALDAVAAHPIGSIPEAAGGIRRTYFAHEDEAFLESALFFVPRLAVAVPDFALLWTLRAFWMRPTTPAPPPAPPQATPSPAEGMEVIPVVPGLEIHRPRESRP